MPKNPTPKTRRKVTQLDPLKPIRAQLRAMNAKLNACMSRAETIVRHCDSIYAEVGKLHSLNDEAISDAYERGRKSAPPAPEPKEPEPHRFKEGDWVRSKRHDTMLQIESFSKDGTRFWSNMSDAFGELLECYRPATQAEIDAHLEAEAIKKQEAERRAEEEAKPIEFGTWVKSATTEKTFRTACDGPDAEGDYRCIANDNSVAYLRRSEFTVISPKS